MRPRVIGLTGGIGTGKSSVGAMLKELGAEVIDADQVARDIVQPGLPAYDEIVAEFGRDILQPDGTIDRKKLGARVFADDKARRLLNSLTHPRIAIETTRRIGEAGARGVKVVIYEATLLVENGLHRALDGLIVVDAQEADQIARVIGRDGLSEEEVRRRIAAQLPAATRLKAADWVVRNDGSLADLRREVEGVWKEIERK